MMEKPSQKDSSDPGSQRLQEKLIKFHCTHLSI